MFLLDKYRQLKSDKVFRDKVTKWASIYPKSQYNRKKIIEDYMALYTSKGLTMDEYYEFEFEKRSEDFRKSFLGLNEQRHYLDLLNPIKYYILARNKFIAHKMLEDTGVRKSTLYCYYQPESRVNSSLEIASTIEDVCRILKAKGVLECVVKTTESSHGDNVWVIKNISYKDTDAEMTRFDEQKLMLSEFLKDTPLVFESVIHQTHQFANLNSSSVNTIRFMTSLYPDGSAKIIATFIKIGRSGKCVDNAGSGGNVDVCVDVKTGELRYAIQYDGWRNIKEIDCHPDSGNSINGVVIDNWEAIKAEVIKFQQAFPYCKIAGWDIAITDEGPVVIEVNDFWDRTGQYFIRKGWRNEIRDCYKAWKKENRNNTDIGRLRNRLSLKHLQSIESYE